MIASVCHQGASLEPLNLFRRHLFWQRPCSTYLSRLMFQRQNALLQARSSDNSELARPYWRVRTSDITDQANPAVSSREQTRLYVISNRQDVQTAPRTAPGRSTAPSSLAVVILLRSPAALEGTPASSSGTYPSGQCPDLGLGSVSSSLSRAVGGSFNWSAGCGGRSVGCEKLTCVIACSSLITRASFHKARSGLDDEIEICRRA